MKKIALSLLLTSFAMVAGCGGMNNSTSMDAAKTLMEAMTKGDRDTIEKLDHASALDYPPSYMITLANETKIVGKSLNDFKFEQVDDRHVRVSFDSGNQKYRWILTFNKEKDGYYFVNRKAE
jgi:hypothetical protein